MIDPSELKYMIKLLDDPDEEIRSRIIRDLNKLGPKLDSLITDQNIFLTHTQRVIIDSIKLRFRKKALEDLVAEISIKDPTEKELESFVCALSEYLSPFSSGEKLKARLDEITADYKESASFLDAFSLSRYLFKVRGFTGNIDDYFNPLNSDLNWVIEECKGIPITLSVLLILIARRMNIEVSGCNFPGHFMAWFREDEEIVVVDCFGGGKFLYLEKMRKTAPDLYKFMKMAVEYDADDIEIIERMLRNLVLAYQKRGDLEQSDYFSALLTMLQTDIITDSEM